MEKVKSIAARVKIEDGLETTVTLTDLKDGVFKLECSTLRGENGYTITNQILCEETMQAAYSLIGEMLEGES